MLLTHNDHMSDRNGVWKGNLVCLIAVDAARSWSPAQHMLLAVMTAMVAVGSYFSLAEARLVSPHLDMNSGCLPGRIWFISVLREFILCVISTLLLPCAGALWGTAGNVSLFLQLLTGQVFQGACFPAPGSYWYIKT